MLLIMIAGLVLVASAAALIVRGLAMPRVRTNQTVDQVAAYGYSAGATTADPVSRTPVLGMMDALANRVGGLFGGRFGMGESQVRLLLVEAGVYTMTPRRYVGYRVLSLVCVPSLALYAATVAHFPPLLAVVALALAAWAGWVIPGAVLDNRKRKRFELIDRELPELIDLLVVTVEAGLGFNNSLQVAAQRLEGSTW